MAENGIRDYFVSDPEDDLEDDDLPTAPSVMPPKVSGEPVVAPETPLGKLPPEEPVEPMGAVPQDEAEAPSKGALKELLSSLEEEAETPAEVISTDTLPGDFEVSVADVGYSPGLGDELTALTGGGAKRQRHAVTVNKIPEPGQGEVRLHRDRMVGPDLIRKIIQGIENL